MIVPTDKLSEYKDPTDAVTAFEAMDIKTR